MFSQACVIPSTGVGVGVGGGGSAMPVPTLQGHTPPRNYKSGQYTSY